MEEGEDEPEDVRLATPVEDEIQKAEADEPAKEISNFPKNKDKDDTKKRKKESGEEDCCTSKKKMKKEKGSKWGTIYVFDKECKISKPNTVPRHCLSKKEHLDMLATPSRKCEPQCLKKPITRKLKPIPPRIAELARPPMQRILRTIEDRGDTIPPELLDNLINMVEAQASLSPEQAAQLFYDKKSRSTKKCKKKKGKIKCGSKKDKEKRKENGDHPYFDPEAVCCQYLMAEQFVKSILDWKCPIPKEEYRDIAEVILRRLSFITEYTPIDNGDRKSQQMRFLADVISCWISGVLLEVGEAHKKELKEECEKRKQAEDEETEKEEESGAESDSTLSAKPDDESEEDDEDKEEEKKLGDKSVHKGDKDENKKDEGDPGKEPEKESAAQTEEKEDTVEEEEVGGEIMSEGGKADEEEVERRRAEEEGAERKQLEEAEMERKRAEEEAERKAIEEAEGAKLEEAEAERKKIEEEEERKRAEEEVAKKIEEESEIKRAEEAAKARQEEEEAEREKVEAEKKKIEEESERKRAEEEVAKKIEEESEIKRAEEAAKARLEEEAEREKVEAEKKRIEEEAAEKIKVEEAEKKRLEEEAAEAIRVEKEAEKKRIQEEETVKIIAEDEAEQKREEEETEHKKKEEEAKKVSEEEKLPEGEKIQETEKSAPAEKIDPVKSAEDKVISKTKEFIAIETIPPIKVFQSDLPFVTFIKICNTIYSMIEKEKENTGQDPIINRLHRAVYEKFHNAVLTEDPGLLTENAKDVIDAMTGKIAVWLSKVLTESQVLLLEKYPPEVESKEVRDWSNWIKYTTQTAADWTVWLQKFIKEAQKMQDNKVTHGQWQNFTQNFNKNAYLWRKFHLDTVHKAHHNVMMIKEREVVKTGEKKTSEYPEKEIKVVNLE